MRHENPFAPGRRSKALVEMVSDREVGDLDLAEVLDAELVEDDPRATVPDDVIDSILESYLRDGRLVPAATAVPEGVTDPVQRRRFERARLLDEMRARALADATLRGYGGHVKAWQKWCRAEGVPALPFEPKQVADFLLDYALQWDAAAADYTRDEDGELLASVAMGTVDSRLKALNKAAEFIGMARPGDNPGVKEVMAGLRRRFGTASKGKAALDLTLLCRCLVAAHGITYASARDRVAHLLRARTRATAGQLATLRWENIEVAEDGTSVAITLHKTHRHGQPTTIAVAAHPNPELCLVTALRDLRAIAPQLREVLTHRTGKPLTRQALHASLAEVWDELPTLTNARLARSLATRCPATPLAVTRDRALLLTGFYTALRRSNLSALNWGDLADHGEDGWSIQVRWSKTDQEGQGSTSWVPQSETDGAVACPATALRDWKRTLEGELGRSVRGNEPVFVALTNSGTVKLRENNRMIRLTGDGIHEAVQRLTVAAGLATRMGKGNPYGAHSLRAGFVTEALRDDKLSFVEVMEVTGHKTTTMVVRYRREANAPKRNASRKLLGILNKG
jgi:integrase